MKYSTLNLPFILLMSSIAGQAVAHTTPTVVDQYPDAIAHPDQLLKQDIASRMFMMLPQGQQAKIAQAGGVGSQGYAPPVAPSEQAGKLNPSEFLDSISTPETRANFTDDQNQIIDNILSSIKQGEPATSAMCFAPGTNKKFVYMTSQLLGYQTANQDSSRFQQNDRWTSTATDGGGLGQGDPTTLTYSFALDGSFVSSSSLGSGASTLFAWLDGLYPDRQTWQNLFHSVFQDWEDLIGTTYVYEPNDDGAFIGTFAPGILGVRGDIRIAGYNFPLDGDSGVLAFNRFPPFGGDMIFDAFDTFYDDIGNGSFKLVQVASHEHGHGLGMNHVCPTNQTILMEPFFSTSFLGPQLDDILNGLRHYGDISEPNDSIAQATDLGSMLIGDEVNADNLAIDDNSDQDYFRITVSEPARVVFTVTPDAGVYEQGPQTQNCDSGVLTDYNSIENLQLIVRNSDGISIAIINSGILGQPETMVFDTLDAGDFYFVVDGSLNVNNVQRYRLNARLEDLTFIDPIFAIDPPSSVDPGLAFQFPLTVNPFIDTVIPGSETLFYSIDGGPFSSIPLADDGLNSYLATLPAFSCDESVNFYISIDWEVAGEITFPAGGSSSPAPVNVGSFISEFVDDFETDLGWTVSGPVTGTSSGQWERGSPAGSANRGDPVIDADGSGNAYLTGNAPGNTDVDGGQTILTSPQYDLSGISDAWLSYARWFDNTGAGTGSAPNEDVFTVNISNNNGASWTNLEIVGPDSAESKGGWITTLFRVSDYITPTNAVRVQFIAEDSLNSSVVEAGVDAFLISSVFCEDPPPACPADFNDDGQLDFFDISAFLIAFNAGDISADLSNDGLLNFFDISTFLQEFTAGCP